MSNIDIFELQESLKNIRSLHLSIARSIDSYEEFRSKLAFILVKAKLKRAFLQLINGNSNVLKGLGLKFLISRLPHPYYSESPKVPLWFLTEYNRISQIERLPIKCMWFYADNNTRSQIISSLNGDLNDGYILDYPACCVKWYERTVAREIEILHQYIIDRYNLRTQNEVIDALEHSSARSFSHRFVQMHISGNVEKTVRKFPFIFHIACPACLKELNTSALLNEKYEELALSLEQTFHDQIGAASLDYIKKVAVSRRIFMNEFKKMKKSFPSLEKLENIMKTE